jgi:hypothetical protein
MEDRFIPYPFQNNIRDLDPQTVFDCVNGLIKAQRENKPFSNFKEWVDSVCRRRHRRALHDPVQLQGLGHPGLSS